MDRRSAAETAETAETGAEAGAGRLAARRVPAEAFEARRRALEILGEARAEAGRVLASAEGEAEAVRRAAVEAGRQEGLAAAAAEIARAAREAERLIAASAPGVVAVAVALAERILGRAVVAGDDALRTARAALEELAGARRAVLRASPADAGRLRNTAAELRGALASLRVVEDAALGMGEVVVDADGARLDGRFRCQLAALARALGEAPP